MRDYRHPTGAGVLLAQRGIYDHVFAGGLPPLKGLLEGFLAEGGKLLVCTPCVQERERRRTMQAAGERGRVEDRRGEASRGRHELTRLCLHAGNVNDRGVDCARSLSRSGIYLKSGTSRPRSGRGLPGRMAGTAASFRLGKVDELWGS
jgi:hypothetical protein